MTPTRLIGRNGVAYGSSSALSLSQVIQRGIGDARNQHFCVVLGKKRIEFCDFVSSVLFGTCLCIFCLFNFVVKP
jgi:hypothetical protein